MSEKKKKKRMMELGGAENIGRAFSVWVSREMCVQVRVVRCTGVK